MITFAAQINNTMQRGAISVQTENIFPIIKRFLYSDQEIFLRELVSNAADATTKIRTLSNRGEATGELGELRIDISLDKEAKTLTISDRGIGMTEDEVLRYLNQVAFSSATEFIEKYQTEQAIIGHFGLGFYSCFMVAERVEVLTKSFKDESAVRWMCDGSPNYEMETIEKAHRGTDIILHIGDDAVEYLEKHRIDELLNKYCKFLPVPIFFGTRTEYLDNEEDTDLDPELAEVEAADEADKEPKSIEVPNQVNDPHPLWKKAPSELTDADYIAFYEKLYPYQPEPMFWVHLKIDDPFQLTGVLYFPKLKNTLEVQKNKIQLYSNQVYVTDNVSEIVPEFLLLLHGIIDSPDIPLNVSRSYLQSDREVKKITGYITRKVADKFSELFKKDREAFNEKWNDFGVFVKYGMLSDDKFAEKANEFVLLTSVDNVSYTYDEYLEKVKGEQTDKKGDTIMLYTHLAEANDSYVQAAKNKGYDVLLMDAVLDNHFMQHLEHKKEKISFKRVDAGTLDQLIEKDETFDLVLSETEKTGVESFMKSVVGAGDSVLVKALSPSDQPLQIIRPEFMRRMKEMQSMQGAGSMWGDMPETVQVVVNGNHPIVAQKLAVAEGDAGTDLARHLYRLALLNQGMLKGAELTQFVEDSLKRM
jgi:molecular chaperone HtpG